MKQLMLGLGFVVLWAVTARAQEPLVISKGTVQVGDGLRATVTPSLSGPTRTLTLTGAYAGLESNTLRLSIPPGGTQVHEVDLDEILRLERSRPRTIGEGAGRGALWGGLAGALAGFTIMAFCSSDDYFQCGPGEFLVGSAIVGGMGAGIGAVIGSAARGTTWEEVSLREMR